MHMLKSALALFAAFALLSVTPAQVKKPAAQHKQKIVSANEAKLAAMRSLEGYINGKVSLEKEHGKLVYLVPMRAGRLNKKVVVLASSGKVIAFRNALSAEEARERREREH
jgi:uncharacterized membrane protein YkoI